MKQQEMQSDFAALGPDGLAHEIERLRRLRDEVEGAESRALVDIWIAEAETVQAKLRKQVFYSPILSRDVLDAIKERIDLIGLLEEYGHESTREGRRYRVQCPNPEHPDNNPSCIVYDDPEPHLYCPVCEWGGDAFDVVMTLDHVEFLVAAGKLAGRANVEIDLPAWSKNGKRRPEGGENPNSGGFLRNQGGFFVVSSQNGVEQNPRNDAENEVSSHSSVSSQVPVPEFPVRVLPKPIRDYVTAAADSLDAPLDFVAVPLFAVAASIIGRRWVIQLKRGWIERAILIAAVVAEPGTAKSPGLTYARLPLDERQKTLAEEYERSKEKHKSDMDSWQSSDRKTRGALPQPPVMRHVYTVDATMESLALLAVQNPGVCVVRDELSGWIASFDAYRGGKGGDRQNMLTAWSGGPIKVDRKSGEPLFCLHPAISVTGGIQPDLLPVLANEAGKRDGFVERILYTMPDTGPLCWTEDEVDEQTTSSFMDVFNTLYHGSYHEPPDAIKLSPGAKHSWVTWHRRNQEVVAATKGLRRGIASKMPTQVARFALILHCLEHYKNPATAMISKDEMDAAIELGEYFRRHAERVLSVLGYKPLPQRPLFDERVYQAVARHAGAWVTLTALHKELCGHAPSELLRGALDRLVAEDVIEFKGGTTGPKGGRPSEAWRLSQEKGCEETEKSEETPNAASGLRNRSDGDCEETAKKPPQLRRNPLGGDESGDIGDDQASEEELEWLA